MNVANSVLWRMAIILKANKVNLLYLPFCLFSGTIHLTFYTHHVHYHLVQFSTFSFKVNIFLPFELFFLHYIHPGVLFTFNSCITMNFSSHISQATCSSDSVNRCVTVKIQYKLVYPASLEPKGWCGFPGIKMLYIISISVYLTTLRWVHTCNITAYRNSVMMHVTDMKWSYDLNFHSVPHSITISCKCYTMGYPVCYRS
jgi:hypothetical protein